MCAGVLTLAVRTTADLAWPPDTDHYRDLAQSQTIRDGALLQDPFYRGESAWYNPLLPGMVAAVSYLTGQPVHVSAARAGPYLNLAAPIAFYVLVFRLIGPACALASLAGFLFVVRGPTWATPTYSPWLYASVFAQTFFYSTLAAYAAAMKNERWWWFAITGTLLGLTFLTHTAPAILAGVTIMVVTGWRAVLKERTSRELASEVAFILVPAVLVALPFLWSIVGHYRLQIRNPIPLMWSDPTLPPDSWEALWAQVAPRPLLNTMIVVGLTAISLGRLRRPAPAIVNAWFGASILLFVYSNYVVPRLPGVLPPAVPAHHFLVYERAAEIVVFGLGVTVTASGVGWLVWRAIGSRFKAIEFERFRQGSLGLGIGAIVLVSLPGFLARDDFGLSREVARNQYATSELRELFPWIRENSSPTDVFLTSDSACLSVVGPAGRKCVLAPVFFSNPYVDWNERRVAHQSMWDALTADDCATFRQQAYAYRVRYVMSVESRTPQVVAGRCGLIQTSFPGTNWRIYRASQVLTGAVSTRRKARTRNRVRLLGRRLDVFHHDEHFAGADEAQLLACDGLDRRRVGLQPVRQLAQPRVLLAHLRHARFELSRQPARTRRRHQSALADQRVDQQHDGRKREQIIERPPPDGRLGAERCHTLAPERLWSFGAPDTGTRGFWGHRHRF